MYLSHFLLYQENSIGSILKFRTLRYIFKNFIACPAILSSLSFLTIITSTTHAACSYTHLLSQTKAKRLPAMTKPEICSVPPYSRCLHSFIPASEPLLSEAEATCFSPLSPCLYIQRCSTLLGIRGKQDTTIMSHHYSANRKPKSKQNKPDNGKS